MYIVRWLMGHPIIAAWFLAIIAILLNVGNKNETDTDSAHNDDTKIVETVATSETPSAASTVATVSDTAATSTTTTVDAYNVTSTSYPDGLEAKKEVVNESEEFPTSTESVSSDGEKAESVSESAPVTPEVESKAVTSAENTVETSSGAVVTTTTVDSINATSRSYPDGLTSIAEQTSKETETVVQEVATNEVTTSTGNAEVPKSDTAQAEEKGSDATISDLGEISNEEMLLMAREAYWNNGLEEAAQIYKQLIKIEPEVIEHRGELGNVYWRQGYPKKAAELYSEIALPMIEQGNSERVANMVGFIGLFYPDRASEIHKRLQSTETKSQ